MRPVSYTLSATGVGPWVPLDYNQSPFAVGLGVKLSAGAVLTYTVQHTFVDIFSLLRLTALTRAATVATITFSDNVGLSVADWLNVQGAGAPFDGEYAVATVVGLNQVTYTVANTGPTSVLTQQGVGVAVARIFPHAVLAAQTASMDGNYAFQIRACRLNVTAFTSGQAVFSVAQATGR